MKPREHEGLPPFDAEGISESASDAALDARLDRVTGFTRRMLQVPVVWLSLNQGADLKVRRVQGLPTSVIGTRQPLDELALTVGRALVFPDGTSDPHVEAFRAALAPTGLRAYASCPIRDSAFKVTGLLTIADTVPRAWGNNDLMLLKDLAALAESDVLITTLGESRLQLLAMAETLRNCALVDPLTQLWNRTASIELVEREVDRARRYEEPVTLIMAGLDDLAALRSIEGAAIADLVVVEVANRLRDCFRGTDIVGRVDDDCFLGFLGRCTLESARAMIERVRAHFVGTPIRIGAIEVPVTLSFGVASSVEVKRWSPQDLVEAAIKALAAAREAGIDQVSVRGLE